MSGKGSRPRPVKGDTCRSNWESVFGKPKRARKKVAKDKEQLFVVALYDGFDNHWITVSEPLPRAQADRLCGDKNAARLGSGHGCRTGCYGHIDYYKVWPADQAP